MKTDQSGQMPSLICLCSAHSFCWFCHGSIIIRFGMITVNVLKFLTLLFLFSIKLLVFMAVINNILVRITNREDPDQTASSEAD